MATLAQIRDGFLEEYIGGSGFRKLTSGFTYSSDTTLQITSSNLPNASLDPDAYVGWDIFRPTLSVGNVDRERFVDESTSTANALDLTHAGIPWTDVDSTGETVYLIRLPDGMSVEGDLHPLINKALRKTLYEDRIIVGNLVTEGDMRGLSTDWGYSNAAGSMVTTDDKVFDNVKALYVENSGTNGYAESDEFPVEPNTGYVVSAIAKVVQGTAELRCWNVTTDAVMTNGTIQWETTPFSFLHLYLTTGSTQRKMKIRIGGTTATSKVAYSMVEVHDPNSTYAKLPSYIAAKDQVKGFMQLVPTASAHDETDIYLAESLRHPDHDGEVDIQTSFVRDAKGYFPRTMGTWPVVAKVIRPGIIMLDTTEDLVEETDVTAVPLEYILPHVAVEFWNKFTTIAPGSDIYDAKALAMLERAEMEAQRIRLAYKPSTKRKVRSQWASRRGYGSA